MSWWQKLRANPLARFGATILITLYLAVIFADFVAPYDPYEFQPNGSLLPPTPIYLNNQAGGQINQGCNTMIDGLIANDSILPQDGSGC